MRLMKKGREKVLWAGKEMWGAVRPLSGQLSARLYGEYVQNMLRVLLPWNAVIAPGDRVEVGGAPYVCAAARFLLGHVQADLRRCAR
ncbi:MAG: hypothetical protein E7329_08165 [Clostridiales bacterium]|nr:hypothetical protein [Clostridiales bacterium]